MRRLDAQFNGLRPLKPLTLVVFVSTESHRQAIFKMQCCHDLARHSNYDVVDRNQASALTIFGSMLRS
jgi:hypothetical protein